MWESKMKLFLVPCASFTVFFLSVTDFSTLPRVLSHRHSPWNATDRKCVSTAIWLEGLRPLSGSTAPSSILTSAHHFNIGTVLSYAPLSVVVSPFTYTLILTRVRVIYNFGVVRQRGPKTDVGILS